MAEGGVEDPALAPALGPDRGHDDALDPGVVLMPGVERGGGQHLDGGIDMQVILLGMHGEG